MLDTVYFVDAGIADYQNLIAGLPADAEVIVLDSCHDGLLQMAKVLAGRMNIQSIHVLSHGSAGELLLGASRINRDNLSHYASSLAVIGASCAADADLMLYGCHVSQGEAGNTFIAMLADMTQLDVAASFDVTGSVAMGGDWMLETQVGCVEAQALTIPFAGTLSSSLISNDGAFAAIKSDGSVVTWGFSGSGGDSSAVADKLDGSVDVVQIYPGMKSFYALRSDGSVVSWGSEDYALWNESAIRFVDVAEKLDGRVDVLRMYCSDDRNTFAALRADGSVVLWGNSFWLVDGDIADEQLDSRIGVIDVRLFSNRLVAMRTDGTLVFLGYSNSIGSVALSVEEINNNLSIDDVVFSDDGDVAILYSDGSVSCYPEFKMSDQSFSAETLGIKKQLDGSVDVTRLLVVDGDFYAIRSDGSLIGWSIGDNGSLYRSTDETISTMLDGSIDVVDVILASSLSGSASLCALREDGSVVAWGDDQDTNHAVMRQLDGRIKVVSLTASVDALSPFFGAVREDGVTVKWGAYYYETQYDDRFRLIQNNAFSGLRSDGSFEIFGGFLSKSSDLKSIIKTYSTSTALGFDGSVFTRGYPEVISNVLSVEYGYGSFAAVRTDGSVFTWGDIDNGGDSRAVAHLLDGRIPVVKVFVFSNGFAALRSDGLMVTWGSAYSGNDKQAISKLDSSVDIVHIYSSSYYGGFAALRANGSLVLLGRTENGNIIIPKTLDGRIKINEVLLGGYDHSAFAVIRSDGSVMDLNGNFLSDQLDGRIAVTHFFGNMLSYVVIRSDGSVVTGGHVFSFGGYGTDKSSVDSRLNGSLQVVHIYQNDTYGAFAALLADGSVVAWGNASFDQVVAAKLDGNIDVVDIFSNSSGSDAFVALRVDGSLVAWGAAAKGFSDVADLLDGDIDVAKVFLSSIDYYFDTVCLALRVDGSLVTWGNSTQGDSSAVSSQLNGDIDVVDVFFNHGAYAALRADGSLVTWGASLIGGDSSNVASQLDGSIDVVDVFMNRGACAALRADGSVVTWGDGYYAVSSIQPVADQLDGRVDVVKIYSTGQSLNSYNYYSYYSGAFFALRADGSLVTWGDAASGGDSRSVASELDGHIDVVDVFFNGSAVCALRADGSLVTWGGGYASADSRGVASQLASGVKLHAPLDEARMQQAIQLGIRNSAPTGLLDIVGIMTQGEKLRVYNTLADEDGITSISYQWYADGVAIPDATGDSMEIEASQVGRQLTVRAMYTDDLGHPEQVSSRGYGAVGRKVMGSAKKDVLSFSAGDDLLFGLAGHDVISGGAGDDTLDGGLGNDSMKGGAAHDVYRVDTRSDVVTELAQAGYDCVETTLSAYILGNHVENLRYTGRTAFKGTGNALSNYIQGGPGNDVLDGKAGTDTLDGGAGRDTLILDNEGDVFTFGADDTVMVAYPIHAYSLPESHMPLNAALLHPAIVELTGNAGNNHLKGNEMANIINGGGGGNDTLTGAGGNDTLISSGGADLLQGGKGSDTFVFRVGANRPFQGDVWLPSFMPAEWRWYDVIKDFTKGKSGDIIDFSEAMSIGGVPAVAMPEIASVSQKNGIVTFAQGSGLDMQDALKDIRESFAESKDTSGAFALFKVKNSGDYFLFISDGQYDWDGGEGDVVIQLTGVKSLNNIAIHDGDLMLSN